MKHRRLFLRWALFAVLLVIGTVIVTSLGWMGQLLDADVTPITKTTLIVFTVSTALCGRLCWKHDEGRDHQATLRELENGWFASSVCVTLGLLGTAIGFYLMLRYGADGGGDVKGFVEQIRKGLNTALGTTITGGISGLLLELQCHSIKRIVEESPPNAGAKK